MDIIKKFINENKHFLYMLIWIPLLLVFGFCQKFLSAKYIMHSSIDDHIPFIKFFIIPYVVWYFYIGGAFVYFGLKCKEDFLKLTKFIFWGMSISYIIYIIWPSGQNLRPVLMENDIFTKTIGLIYYIDPPVNVCPSIHVMDSIGVNLVVCNSELFKGNKKVKVISTITAILICISTMFIKQHSVIDVISGVVLSVFLYVFVFFIPNLRSKINKARHINWK